MDGIASVLIGLGLMMRVWAWYYLREQFHHGLSLVPSRLVKSGPYKYFNHPMYIGSILLLSGVCWFSIRIAFLLLVVFHYLLRMREEDFLMGRFKLEA
jgi:protein-S-isoprenylcysteine O-methyltransferase Ste14